MVPLANIITVVTVILLSVALPLAACLVVRKATRAGFVNLLVGMAVFFVCYLIALATQILFSLFIGSQTLLVLVLSLRAGLVEEFGRFVAFKFFLRKKRALGDAVMYGVGHGGIEVLLVYTLAMASSLSLMLMANTGALDALVASAPEQAAVLRDTVDTLAESSPLFLSLGLFERVSAMILHISLSVVVFCAVRQRKALYLVLAILLHTLTNSLILLLVNGWVGTELLELLLFAAAAACALIAWRLAHRYTIQNKAATAVEPQAETPTLK
jgi:uncharacterized membrane protein YhfC